MAYFRCTTAQANIDREGDLPFHGCGSPTPRNGPPWILDGRRSTKGLPLRYLPLPLLPYCPKEQACLGSGSEPLGSRRECSRRSRKPHTLLNDIQMLILTPSLQTAQIDPSAVIGPNVVVGPKCVIGKGVRLQRCVIMDGARVKDHAWIHSSIVGWNSTVGRWVRMENITVLGDDGESFCLFVRANEQVPDWWSPSYSQSQSRMSFSSMALLFCPTRASAAPSLRLRLSCRQAFFRFILKTLLGPSFHLRRFTSLCIFANRSYDELGAYKL